MAHFARVNDNNRVENIIVINNDVVGEPELAFPETESVGQTFIKEVLGFDGTWLQTSYNNSFRKNFASSNGFYDPESDIFISPQPFDSWTLSEETKDWESPIPYPEDGLDYFWNERTLSWELINS